MPKKFTSAFLLVIGSIVAVTLTSQAAVTITISANSLNATTATVGLSGSLSLIDNLSSGSASVVPVTRNDGVVVGLGAAPTEGRPTTSPFKVSNSNSNGIGALPDSAMFVISDTSDGGATIVLGPINNLAYVGAGPQAGRFDLVLDGFTNYPISIDAGDVLSLSGSFDMDLGVLDFSSRFNIGTHTGTYNGQDVNVVVANPVPEPSAALLAFLGFAPLSCLRRR